MATENWMRGINENRAGSEEDDAGNGMTEGSEDGDIRADTEDSG